MVFNPKSRICKTCNKPFLALMGRHYYCCKACRPKFKKKCKQCLNAFEVSASYKNHRFCSKKCSEDNQFMQNNWKQEDATKLAKWGWFRAHFKNAYECHNTNCNGKSKNYVYIEIEQDVEKDRVKNFAQLCNSCKCYRAYGNEPSWDWHKIDKWHHELELLIKTRKKSFLNKQTKR